MGSSSHWPGLWGKQQPVSVLCDSGHWVAPWLHDQGLSLRHVGVRALGLRLGVRQPRAKLDRGGSVFSFCTPILTWCTSYSKPHLSLILYQLSLKAFHAGGP